MQFIGTESICHIAAGDIKKSDLRVFLAGAAVSTSKVSVTVPLSPITRLAILPFYRASIVSRPRL